MSSSDARVDRYIASAAGFARPILEALRERVHAACPDVEETLKWSSPAFLYRGRILCSMAAFKQHASFGFWQHAQVLGDDVARDGMGSFGKMSSIADVPSARALAQLLRKAMALIDGGVKPPTARKSAAPKPPPEAPSDLRAALDANGAARRTFDAFPPGQQREYVEWIVEAKRDETRQRRVAQAVEWLAEGKKRNWKYENC